MNRVIIAPSAQRDIDAIVDWSRKRFGVKPAVRYERLIEQAIFDVSEEPMRAGSVPIPELGATARSFHLRNSRKRAASPANRAKRPRHMLLYRNVGADAIEIARVLHERMDIDEILQDPSR